MNCEFTIEKQNLHDTKVILLSYIEDTFGLKIHPTVDKIFTINKSNIKIEIDTNDLEDLKDTLPESIKIIIEKKKNVKEDMNHDQIDKFIDEIEFGTMNDNPREESFIIGKYDDSEVFKKIIEFIQFNNVTIPFDLDSHISNKKYYTQFKDILKWISESKYCVQTLSEKVKTIECSELKKVEEIATLKKFIETSHNEFMKDKTHLVEENCMLQTSYLELKKNLSEATIQSEKLKLENNKLTQMNMIKNTNCSDENMLRQKVETLQKKLDEVMLVKKQNEMMINKFEKSFYNDVMNNNYMPSDEYSGKKNDVSESMINDFYNHIVFQAKHNFINKLTQINDFLEANSGMIGIILDSKKYKSMQNLVKIDVKKLETGDFKEKCEIYSIFIQNIMNIME